MMTKRIPFLLVGLIITSFQVYPQIRFISRDGKLVLNAATPLENTEGYSSKAAGILEPETGNFQAAVLMKSFLFKKDMMQQHFNEDYVESDKFPKAVFKGVITNIGEINFSVSGEYKAAVSGKMELHGVTKDISLIGRVITGSDSITVKAVFYVKPEDYNIRIPVIVRDKIANEVLVTLDMKMKRLINPKEKP